MFIEVLVFFSVHVEHIKMIIIIRSADLNKIVSIQISSYNSEVGLSQGSHDLPSLTYGLLSYIYIYIFAFFYLETVSTHKKIARELENIFYPDYQLLTFCQFCIISSSLSPNIY